MTWVRIVLVPFQSFLCGTLALALAAAAVRESVVGVWTGKYLYDFSKLPPNLTTKQREQTIGICRERAKSKLTLTLKSDHSYSLVASGSVAKAGALLGKWTQDATSVTLLPKGSRDGSVTLTFDKPGKKMAFTNGPATLSFSR